MRILSAAILLTAVAGGTPAFADGDVGCQLGQPTGVTVNATQCRIWDMDYIGYYAPSRAAAAYGYAYAPMPGAYGYAYAPVRTATSRTIPRTDKVRRLNEY
jgi:hypothetical protein